MHPDKGIKVAGVTLQPTREFNPLLEFLGNGTPGPSASLPASAARRVIFSEQGGLLVKILAQASRVRLYASLGFLEIAANDLTVDEIVSFLTSAPDNAILERVLENVEAPGTKIASGLKAALREAEPPISAGAIGLLNRFIALGVDTAGALRAVHVDRYAVVRRLLDFGARYAIHPLTPLIAHLCPSEGDLLAVDSMFQQLAGRAPGALPSAQQLLGVKDFDDLGKLCRQSVRRHRGKLAMPPAHHPNLTWIDTVSRMNEVALKYRNCLKDFNHIISVILGRSFIGIYSDQNSPDQEPFIIRVLPTFDDCGISFLEITEAKMKGNSEVSSENLIKAVNDLTQSSGIIWRIGEKIIKLRMNFYDY